MGITSTCPILKIIAPGQNTTIVLLFHICENIGAQSVGTDKSSQIAPV